MKGYKNSEALKIITDELTKQGYDWDMDVYNAADYGGYTKRERLIVRAVRDGKLPEKPLPLPESERKQGWWKAVEDLIDDLPEKKSGVAEWMDTRLKGEGIDYRKIDKPLYVFGQGNNAHSVSHAFADELIPTLRTKGGDVIIMPDGRVLQATPRVLARLTGLGDDYQMPETDQLAHTIIGNGIPTQLSENVIGPLLDHAFNEGERASNESMITDRRNNEKRDTATQLTSAMHLDGEVEVLETNEGLEGRKRRAKGWYDPETGKITVVLGNHESAADVQKTIFHEAVAHKGLRTLVGEEIECTNRQLKNDLNLRPIYHQKDVSSDAHLFFGLLAYWVVNTIRYELKQSDIKCYWTEITSRMSTQKLVTTKCYECFRRRRCV